MTRCIQLPILQLLLIALAQLPPNSAMPQDFFFAASAQETAPEPAPAPAASSEPSPPFSDPSDLSAGINLFPVTNLIAASANAEPPAPAQFVRNAMNSGL